MMELEETLEFKFSKASHYTGEWRKPTEMISHKLVRRLVGEL